MPRRVPSSQRGPRPWLLAHSGAVLGRRLQLPTLQFRVGMGCSRFCPFIEGYILFACSVTLRHPRRCLFPLRYLCVKNDLQFHISLTIVIYPCTFSVPAITCDVKGGKTNCLHSAISGRYKSHVRPLCRPMRSETKVADTAHTGLKKTG